MPESSRLTAIVVAHVRALLPEDWLGRAGELFRQTANAIFDTFEEAGVRPRELPTKVVSLAVDKVEGLAQKDKAAAMRDFSEAEERQIDAKLKERSLESRVRKEEAEATLAEIEVINAKLDLVARLREAGVLLRCDEYGNFIVLPVPDSSDFDEESRGPTLSSGHEGPEL